MLNPKKMLFAEAEQILKKPHVAKAILSLKKKGWPENRRSKDWHVAEEGRKFPPKVLVEEAIYHATGIQVDPSNFDQGGEETTNNLLRNLGFPVLKGKSD